MQSYREITRYIAYIPRAPEHQLQSDGKELLWNQDLLGIWPYLTGVRPADQDFTAIRSSKSKKHLYPCVFSNAFISLRSVIVK